MRSPVTSWLLGCALACCGLGHAWAQCSALSDPTSPECNQGSQALSGELPAVALPMPPASPSAAAAAAIAQSLPSISINKTNNYTINQQAIQHLQNTTQIHNITQIQQLQAMQGVPPGVSAQDYQRALNSGIEAATMGMKVQADVLQKMGVMNGLLGGK
ncbi:MAG: hypothetical protein KBT18_03135 [Comamonas sp.]|nr:hypothetical protein [Candidatus Comamonas equi]